MSSQNKLAQKRVNTIPLISSCHSHEDLVYGQSSIALEGFFYVSMTPHTGKHLGKTQKCEIFLISHKKKTTFTFEVLPSEQQKLTYLTNGTSSNTQ